ncbi:MAG: PIN domain-containing protein [Bauldia sp.]|nr:PIN domain-containing protein [Bauldia sp.]
MILVDTSVWLDHFARSDEQLNDLLRGRQVLVHPFVIGEIAMGSMRQRLIMLEELQALRKPNVATDDEVLDFVGRHGLFGRGIGYIDAHLLASVRLTIGSTLWTRDRRLLTAAQSLSIAADLK